MAFGNAVVVMDSGGFTTIVNGLSLIALLASVTRIVKLFVLAALGVPEITPPIDRLRPAGRIPDDTDHLYGV